MTLCVNPECRSLHNSDTAEICLRCDSQLLLKMRYRPIRVLGKGTFGQTFLAIDIDNSVPGASNYPYRRKLSYFYKDPPNEAVKAFLGYATSKQVKETL